jgi:flagellar motility protein MotE (MotC chaperone)
MTARKWKRILPLLAALLFGAKVIALGVIGLHGTTEPIPVLAPNRAIAAMAAQGAYRPPVKDCLQDGLARERSLAAALQSQQRELEIREAALKAEERQLLALKAELTQKMDALRALEEGLNSKIDAERSSETKTYKDLAKVYEAMPPVKAGAMLEKLDIATASGITMNMKRDKAGAIWGYMNSQRAIEITSAIARSRGGAPSLP